MSDILIIVLAALFAAAIGYGVFLAAKEHFRRKRGEQSSLFSHAESEIRGEKQHCDGYSAGTFYW